MTVRELGKDRWASRRNVKAAGLLSGKGTVLGVAHNRYLTYDGPEHQLVSGASRSGKGVGHVIPTLLNWTSSVLVYDVKNELWDVTAGFRSRFSHVLFFNPTRSDSVRFNPLMEIRKGPNEVRDTQNVVEMLVNPAELEQSPDIWDQQASQFLVALILHVLYTEPGGQKNRGGARAAAGFQAPAARCWRTAHRFNPQTGVPEVHPECAGGQRDAAPAGEVSGQRGRHGGDLLDPVRRRSGGAQHRRQRLPPGRFGVRGSADDVVPPATAIGRTVSLLVRLMVNQACRALMEHLDRDNAGRLKRRPLLLLLDEFPTLGHMEFFTMNLRQMAVYGSSASDRPVLQRHHRSLWPQQHDLGQLPHPDGVRRGRHRDLPAHQPDDRHRDGVPGDDLEAARHWCGDPHGEFQRARDRCCPQATCGNFR